MFKEVRGCSMRRINYYDLSIIVTPDVLKKNFSFGSNNLLNYDKQHNNNNNNIPMEKSI